jgi:hypothetical protein
VSICAQATLIYLDPSHILHPFFKRKKQIEQLKITAAFLAAACFFRLYLQVGACDPASGKAMAICELCMICFFYAINRQ